MRTSSVKRHAWIQLRQWTRRASSPLRVLGLRSMNFIIIKNNDFVGIFKNKMLCHNRRMVGFQKLLFDQLIR